MNAGGLRFDPQELRERWTQVASDDLDARSDLRERLGVDFDGPGTAAQRSAGFTCVCTTVVRRVPGGFEVDRVSYALGADRLVTEQPGVPYAVFERAIAQLRRAPELTTTAGGIMCALLRAMTDESAQALAAIQDELDSLSKIVFDTAAPRRGHDALTRRTALERLTGIQRPLVAVVRGQWSCRRAARRLYDSCDDPLVRAEVESLITGIDSLRDEAVFENGLLRLLRQAAIAPLPRDVATVGILLASLAVLGVGVWLCALSVLRLVGHEYVYLVAGAVTGASLLGILVPARRSTRSPTPVGDRVTEHQ